MQSDPSHIKESRPKITDLTPAELEIRERVQAAVKEAWPRIKASIDREGREVAAIRRVRRILDQPAAPIYTITVTVTDPDGKVTQTHSVEINRPITQRHYAAITGTMEGRRV